MPLEINDSKFLLCSPGLAWLHNSWAVELGVLHTCKPLVAVLHGFPGIPLHQHNMSFLQTSAGCCTMLRMRPHDAYHATCTTLSVTTLLYKHALSQQ